MELKKYPLKKLTSRVGNIEIFSISTWNTPDLLPLIPF